jgi:formate hydrogenlyase subunit 6/NADH:ubiquinone oxidoreductase subunit I
MPSLAASRLALKWAFRKPLTSNYPFVPRRPLPGSRGQLTFDQATCIYCTLCAKKCPTAALAVDRKAKTWSIDRLACISCGACVDACTRHSLALDEMHSAPAVCKERECYAEPPPPPAPPPAPAAAAPAPEALAAAGPPPA